jgi:hypothetical protein
MSNRLRPLARRLVGVKRTGTYYLPWLTRPGLECSITVHNVEARFKPGYNEGPFPATVTQHDADGRLVQRYEVVVRDSTDVIEVPLRATPAGSGIVTVHGARLHSDLFVTLSDGSTSAATHGRGEFIEAYPWWTRALLAVVGAGLSIAGRTLGTFARDQFVYLGSESRSHVLLMNLSNVVNRVRVVPSLDGARLPSSLVRLPPLGTHLLDVARLAPSPARGTAVLRLRLEANAWFNFYLVGAGPRDLAGPLSLMHVK